MDGFRQLLFSVDKIPPLEAAKKDLSTDGGTGVEYRHQKRQKMNIEMITKEGKYL